MKEVDSIKRIEASLSEALSDVESRNPVATEYWLVARITGCESVDFPMLPESEAYEATLDGGIKKYVVRYQDSFWDVERYVIEANRERDEKMPFPFGLATTDQEKEAWLADFGKVVDTKASKAAQDIAQGLCVSIPQPRLIKFQPIEG